jgi:YfiH family protein
VTVARPFYRLGDHLAVDLPGARALFTTRRGGCSSGTYASLNLGPFTDDDPANVAANLDAVAAEHSVTPVWGHQVHGDGVRTVTDRTASDPKTEADGWATSSPGLAPMITCADCLAVAIAGDGAVAMVHAGWRGLAAGILAGGVESVRRLGAGGRLQAAIGPGAGACCYEVGEEVHEVFARDGQDVRRGGRLDLKAVARVQLVAAGVELVHDIDVCTICGDRELFFSHRRDRGVTGRQAGLVWLT